MDNLNSTCKLQCMCMQYHSVTYAIQHLTFDTFNVNVMNGNEL